MLLLTSSMLAGCLNPTLYDEPQVKVNHAPEVDLDDLFPKPGFQILIAEFGNDCRPLTFRIEVDDADRDTLTLRYILVFPAGAAPPYEENRQILLEKELVPIEDPDPAGPFYDLAPFELTDELLRDKLFSEFDAQRTKPDATQLLELRISDGDFIAGTDDVPLGRGLFFTSWQIDLRDAPGDPPACGAAG